MQIKDGKFITIFTNTRSKMWLKNFLIYNNTFEIFNLKVVKFIYSEKATKFCEIFTVALTGTKWDKSTVEISQNFVAFSEYMNFTFDHQIIFFCVGRKNNILSFRLMALMDNFLFLGSLYF